LRLNGKRHRLVLYSYALNRWWRATLTIGLILLGTLFALQRLPAWLLGYQPVRLSELVILQGRILGWMAVLLSLFLAFIRNLAFVQPNRDHLLLATPFLHLKISYRRLIQTSSTEMGRLFNPAHLRGLKKLYFAPFQNRMAVVLEIKGWPLPRNLIRLFLSSWFFPGETCRLALLVPDWISFSTELESFRGAWLESIRRPGGTPQSDLLAGM
jgi:hypothetical protein